MAFYDSERFGHRTRQWFGLGAKWGGQMSPYMYSSFATLTISEKGVKAGGFFLGTHDPGTITHVEKWYPPGPIEIKKVGVFVCSTLTNASGAGMNFQFLTRGASASVVAAIKMASCTVAEAARASDESPTVAQCKAGEYITIKSFEPTTFSATASEKKATTSGRVAFFLDWVPTYDTGGRWE